MAKPKGQHLYIKNMVCDRCIKVVREELLRMGHDVRNVKLGEAELGTSLSSGELGAVKGMLEENGFELIEDRNARTIESIKTVIIRLVHHDHEARPMRMRTSEYIAREVGKEYHALSVLFSTVENVTIEQYLIRQRIERVKELMKYDDRTLSEIAAMMDYSSVQHLSTQFKSVTGLTPSEFKSLTPSHRKTRRIPLDKV